MKLRLQTKIFCLLISLLVVGTSCDKEHLKNPSTLAFSLKMEENNDTTSFDNLKLDSTNLVLRSFSIVGDRANAENFEFSRYFTSGLQLDLKKDNLLQDLKFDLPQGTYQQIVVKFEIADLEIFGRYTYLDPQVKQSLVHFQLGKSRTFEIQMTNALGTSTQDLYEQMTRYPQIIFEPKSWFGSFSEPVFENASVAFINNQPMIKINSKDNLFIFNLMNQYMASNIKCYLY